MRRRGRRGSTRAGVVVALSLCSTGAALGAVALGNASGKANRSRCHNNLRQLGLGALSYGDDRRFLPHVGPLQELGGGVESNHATRVLRTLVNTGYLEGGYGFICPESNDEAVEPVMTTNREPWTWGALRGTAEVDPASAEAPDPILAETTELSYGWTRRSLRANDRCSSPLAADRAVRERDADATDDPLQGNHVGGMSLLRSDASVSWMSDSDPARDALTSVDRGGGALGILPAGQPRTHRSRAWWEAAGLEGLALVPLGLGGLVLLLRGEPIRSRPRVAALTRIEEAADVQPAQRCPFCHDGVDHARAEDVAALTRCSGCSAVFHAECVPHGGACTTLGCPGAAA